MHTPDPATGFFLHCGSALLWIAKWLGAIFLPLSWLFLGYGTGLFKNSDGLDPLYSASTLHIFLAIGIAWTPIYVLLVLPARRWLASAAISADKGLPWPKWETFTGGSVYSGVDRWIGSAGCTGVVIHPSEDGINDLGQVDPLSKAVVNPFGYREIRVTTATRNHCEHCGREHRGERQCLGCGWFLTHTGRIDWDKTNYMIPQTVRLRPAGR